MTENVETVILGLAGSSRALAISLYTRFQG
jgi:hypothetical protein